MSQEEYDFYRNLGLSGTLQDMQRAYYAAGDGVDPVVATSVNGVVTGLEAGGSDALANIHIKPPYTPVSRDNVGSLAINIGTVTTGGATRASVVANSALNSVSGNALKLTSIGTGDAVIDLTVSLPLTAQNRWIGFWAYKPGTNAPAPIRIYFTADNFANFSNSNVLIYPGLHFYVIPLPTGYTGQAFTSGGGSGFTIPGTITKIRIKDTGGLPGVAYSTMPSGETVEIGDLYLDPVAPKAKFLIGFDDCKDDLLIPGGTAIEGGDGVSRIHSYVSFVASYGWRTNAYIITGAVGNSGYLSQYALARGRDQFGVIYGAHSHSHPAAADVAGATTNAGMRVLGPYGYGLTSGAGFTASATGLSVTPANDSSAIITDIQTCLDKLTTWGFYDATRHFALPQGGQDKYVNAALESFGFRSVRNIYEKTPQHQWGSNTVSVNGFECRSIAENLMSSYQTDPAADPGDSAVQAYIDMIIAYGGIGTNYCHGFAGSAVTRTVTKRLCDYLAVRSADIDVVTLADI